MFLYNLTLASLGSSKGLVKAAKRQLLPGAGMCPAWLSEPQAGVQGFQDAPSFLLLSLVETRTQGAEDYNVPPQIPSKISDSASSTSICSPWDAPRFPPAKAIDANMPLAAFPPFQFPFLAEVLWYKPLLCLSWTQLPLTHLKQHP